MRYANSFCTVLLLTGFLAACAASYKSLPTAQQLIESGTAPKAVDKNALERGRALAVTRCAGCHRFFFPEEYTPKQWGPIIRGMGRLGSLEKKQVLEITEYFQAASKGGS